MPNLVHRSSNGLARRRAALALVVAASSGLAGALVSQPSQAAQQTPEYRLVLLDGAPTGASSRATGINEAGQIVSYTEHRTWRGVEQRAVLWDKGAMTLLGTGNSSMAHDINNKGQVVGTSGQQAVLWSSGQEVLLAAPAGYSSAQAINDAGQIVGAVYGQFGLALRWGGGAYGSYDTLPSLAGGLSLANDINEAGHIVGASESADGFHHAVIWKDGVVADLDPDSNFSEAFGINDQGQVVGTQEFGWYAVLWSGGSEQVLHHNYGTWGYAVNNNGTIVGGDYDGDAQHRALTWNDDGAMTELNSLVEPSQTFLARALDVNDRGWVVGYALNSQTNLSQAFVLIPVPEPATYALLLSGVVVLATMRGRRRKTNSRI